MAFSHEDIMDFMKRYFDAFNTLAQNPDTSPRMYEYYSPELKVTQFFLPIGTAAFNREQFLRISSSHPEVQETLIPEHIIVDAKQNMAAAFLRGEFTVKATKEVIVQMFTAHYQLIQDENNTIKIKDLLIFAEYLPPGKQNIGDLYENAFRNLQ